MKTPLVFASSSYLYLAREVARRAKWSLGEVHREHFNDGERYQKVNAAELRGRNVVLVGGTVSDTETLEIFDLACTVVQNGALSLTLVIPYYGYQTQERAVEAGDAVPAKTRATLFSAIPSPPGGMRIVLMDLHTDGITYYFENSKHAEHLYCEPIVLGMIKELGGKDFVLGTTDAGRAKWVEALALELDVPIAYAFKRRKGRETELVALSALVKNKHVVLYDDILRSGSSALGAAEAYLSAGATSASLVVTHAVLPGEALAKIKRRGILQRIRSTNTHPRAVELEDGQFFKIHSVGALIAQSVRRGWGWP